MATIISLALQKGGSAKTTTAVNLSAELQAKGKRVLLIDMDSQANSSFSSGINTSDLDNSLYNVLTTNSRYSCRAREAILHTDFFDILPADLDVADLAAEIDSPIALKKAITSIQGSYDVIILDCPPSLNILTVNAFVCSDWIIIPTQPQPFFITGLMDLEKTITDVRKNWNPKLKVMGILLTKYNDRTKLSKKLTETIDALSSRLNTSVFETAIRESIVVPESQLAQAPLRIYSPKSKPSVDYEAFALEVINRMEE